MLEPWNDRSILPPPINTSKCSYDIDLIGLKHACTSIIHILSKQSPLHKESAIFSRFVYKFDKKFRNDIGYKNFKKVNTALRRYLVVGLLKDVQKFLNVLPSEDESSPYFPTKQMLEYVLVRLITFSKIMFRITVCSKKASIFYLNRIRRGESHWMCLMPYALLSRVWSLSLVLLQHSSKWYSRLHQYLNQLPDKGVSIFAHDYEIPDNLDTLINIQNINKVGRFEWTQKLSLDVDAILVEDEEGELCESILKYVNNINKTSIKTAKTEKPDIQMTLPVEDRVVDNMKQQTMKNSQKVNNDQGVAISREMFKKLYKKDTTETNPVQKEKKIINHNIENVVDGNSLQKFVRDEEEFRNNSDEKSLTTHLSFMQWQALKTALLKLDNPLKAEKLVRKTKKIWQNKCLDYK
ncbi:hypothetical protein KGM_208492 [Danaus plexippus plexippus]|uniref:Uncharacterized protein n=1 Tax=Danaus plexippus plexippus TaxID=278856 RepID=A0A212F3I3_DANPL|nr:hypothetical protein KGM_208492 [Danaus plexippus plexippus]